MEHNKAAVVGVVAKNSLAYVEAMFDSYARGAVVVLLRSKDDKKRIELTGVNEVVLPDIKFGWFTQTNQFRDENELAQIAFTSGTEGEPKGVLLTHQALSDVTQRLNDIMDVDSSIREYVGIPANFSFGLGRFRAVSAAGGHSYLPENGFDPLEIKQMLIDGEINSISAVPSLWRVLLKNKQIFNEEVEGLKWIEIGSQYMSKSEKEELVDLFPNAKIAQHYGLTEASRSSFLRLDQTKGDHLESVGRAYGETEFKISDTGRICIRGPHVSRTLLKNGSYVENVDSEGWFQTSDLGRLDSGYLYYMGRADDLINCGGIKLSPDALEREIREALSLKDGIAIAAVDDDITGQAVLLAVRNDVELADDLLIDSLVAVLKKYGINNRGIVKFLRLEEFPLTTTNKVQRKPLAKLYKQQKPKLDLTNQKASVPSQKLTPEQVKVSSIWAEILKVDGLDIDKNFYDLGGDSLSAIGALVAMESKGVPRDISRGMLQGLTVREIADRMSSDIQAEHQHQIRSQSLKNTMMISIVRGWLVLVVIFAHWHQGFLERVPGLDVDAFTSFLAPILAMGTPGFAIIYGVGTGYALFPLVDKDPERLKKILNKTALLLFIGIAILAGVRIVEHLLEFQSISFTDVMNKFYSVLFYYLLISLTLIYWFRVISKFTHTLGITFLLSIAVYLFHINFIADLKSLEAEGIFEFIKLLFTAKYAYFLMLSGTLLGIGIGIALEKYLSQSINLNSLYYFGFSAVLVSVAVWGNTSVIDLFNNWPSAGNFIWRWFLYAGLIMILLALVSGVLENYDNITKIKKGFFQLSSIIGVLAFPLFVLHELVIPIKSILVVAGLSDTYALITPMTIFIISSAFLIRRVFNVSYSQTKT
jgi:acyl-CoA synthetase (AMP-forming)/AMP-acid ligase II